MKAVDDFVRPLGVPTKKLRLVVVAPHQCPAALVGFRIEVKVVEQRNEAVVTANNLLRIDLQVRL
ncbi:hypothetical protein D9M69_630220 [compost metagenome]